MTPCRQLPILVAAGSRAAEGMVIRRAPRESTTPARPGWTSTSTSSTARSVGVGSGAAGAWRCGVRLRPRVSDEEVHTVRPAETLEEEPMRRRSSHAAPAAARRAVVAGRTRRSADGRLLAAVRAVPCPCPDAHVPRRRQLRPGRCLPDRRRPPGRRPHQGRLRRVRGRRRPVVGHLRAHLRSPGSPGRTE